MTLERVSALLLVIACHPTVTAAATATMTASGSGLFPTGVDPSGAVLAIGALDPHYKYTSNDPRYPGAQATVVGKMGPNWSPPGPGSMWVSVDSSARTGNFVYTYTTTFAVSGDPTHASITGVIACDDECKILLNDKQVDNDPVPAWHTKHNLSIPAGSPFVAGTNTLTFVVHNLGNVTGLEVYELALSGS